MTEGKTSTVSPDAELVAYLDGELAPADSVRLGQRLASDTALKRRLDQLLAGGRPFRDAMAPLLAAAPKAQLETMLQQALQRPRSAGRSPGAVRPFGLIAAALLMLAVGAGLSHVLEQHAPPTLHLSGDEAENAEWRQAVADYLALYTRDTLARAATVAADGEQDLGEAGRQLGMALTPAKVALGSLPLKRADIYDYDGKPLAFLAYLDPRQGPIALCIIAGSGPAGLRTEQRRDMNVVYWSDRSYSYMLIGRETIEQLQTLAAGVKLRFTGLLPPAG